jgi:hypothetical protein
LKEKTAIYGAESEKSFTENIFVLQLKQTNKTNNNLNKGQGGLISDNNKSLKLLLLLLASFHKLET